jgi:maltose/moltooligosaccharide transporter
MAVYNGFAMVMAFLLPVIAKATNRKLTHLIALTCGGAGLVSFLFLKDPKLLIISEIGIGFAWASILSIPYAILTGSLPHNKMGVYMGIFNFFIVIPQILAASILGVLVRHVFHGQAIYALVLGGFSMILAGIITLFVNDKMVKYEN